MSVKREIRKWPAIDLLHLYSKAGAVEWNAFLTRALEMEDVQGLKKTLYGIQAGMADLAKSGLADRKLCTWFLRIQKSLEDTARKVFRRKYPHPLDNPMAAATGEFSSFIDVKRKRDQEFEAFLREASF